ncbi:MAG: GTP-binding protein [Anaerolineae bacterium]
MDLHIVGGFLGSGKTTAIIGAAKHLMAQGTRVGVVTNDQGKYLVDTAFFAAEAVPAVEVTGGCFCCNYDDLDAQLSQLRETAKPDVIFAESVGSCADIVATVVKPLLELRGPKLGAPSSFSVFADARLLRRRLLDLPMPFSDEVIYLFDKQIEEAGLLVVNKRDLLSPPEEQEVKRLAQMRFPGKPVRLQNSLDGDEVAGWARTLASGLAAPPTASLDIDYGRYGAGEVRLAWLDEKLTFVLAEGEGRAVVRRFVDALLARLQHRGAAIGHLKFMVESGEVAAKVSIPTLETDSWWEQIPELPGTQVTVLVNARVELEAADVHALVHEAAEVAEAMYEVSDVAFFHPSYPTPTYRIA